MLGMSQLKIAKHGKVFCEIAVFQNA